MSKRYVFDTNVSVSVLLSSNGPPFAAFSKARDNGVVLLSNDMYAELERVILRPKFDKLLSLATRLEFLSEFRQDVEEIIITERIQACRDPKDDMVLELAVNGQATCIITGDKDLLILHPFRGIPIVTPADFVDSPDL